MDLQPYLNDAKQSAIIHAVRIASVVVSLVLAMLAGHGVVIRGVNVESIAQVCVAVVSVSIYYVLHHTNWGAKVLGIEQSSLAWLNANAPAILAAVQENANRIAAVTATAPTATTSVIQTTPVAATPQAASR